MLNRILILLTAAVSMGSLLPAQAQEFAWASQGMNLPQNWYPYQGGEPAHPVAVDASGNVYTVGLNTLSKRNGVGVSIWNKSLGGNADIRGIAVDGPGNVFATGFFFGTVDFNPSGGFPLTASSTYGNAFVLRLSSDGGFVYAKQLVSSPTVHVPQGNRVGASAIAFDSQGDIYVTGWFLGSVDLDPGMGVYPLMSVQSEYDSFVLKLSATGEFRWAKKVLANELVNYGVEVAVAPNDVVYVGGLIEGSRNKGSVTSYDSQGNLGHSWAPASGSSNDNQVVAVKVDASGDVYVAGYFSGQTYFPSVGFLHSSGGSWDAYVAKINSAGQTQWAKRLGGSEDDTAMALSVDPGGNVYVAGFFAVTADLDPGPGAYNLTSAGADDVFLCKLDRVGNLAWAGRVGGTSDDVPLGMAADGLGNVYTAGLFHGTVDFDPATGPTDIYNLNGDTFLLKLRTVGSGAVPDGDLVPGVPLRLSKSASQVTLAWGSSCNPTDVDYEVYEGTIGAFTGHSPILCSTGGLTTATTTPPMDQNTFYLVVPRTTTLEGSYGTYTPDAGASHYERAASAAACYPQLRLGNCP